MAESEAWKWTRKRELAARLVADDALTDAEIGRKLNVAPRSLGRWKATPEFAARVTELVATWKEQIRKQGLAVKERRVESLIADFNGTTMILIERGHDLALLDEYGNERPSGVAGGSTGFICRDYKGKDADTPVYAFDAALMKERRELRKQIAQELGEWTEKQELTGKNGGPIEANLSGVPIDRLRQAVEMLNPVKENG